MDLLFLRSGSTGRQGFRVTHNPYWPSSIAGAALLSEASIAESPGPAKTCAPTSASPTRAAWRTSGSRPASRRRRPRSRPPGSRRARARRSAPPRGCPLSARRRMAVRRPPQLAGTGLKRNDWSGLADRQLAPDSARGRARRRPGSGLKQHRRVAFAAIEFRKARKRRTSGSPSRSTRRGAPGDDRAAGGATVRDTTPAPVCEEG
jgi:hypothetical protein